VSTRGSAACTSSSRAGRALAGGVAVVCGEERLTYAELTAALTSWPPPAGTRRWPGIASRHLPGAIAGDRGGSAGNLKAGAAYVPWTRPTRESGSLHADQGRRGVGADRLEAAREACPPELPAWCLDERPSPPRGGGGPNGREGAAQARSREPRLRHVHVRLDRRAQGDRDHSPGIVRLVKNSKLLRDG